MHGASAAQPLWYQYDQLERATGGFAAARRLGAGGFGAVFEAQLEGGARGQQTIKPSAAPLWRLCACRYGRELSHDKPKHRRRIRSRVEAREPGPALAS